MKTLIIGGGIAGITAAVELAETGKEVVLVEKQNYLGGHVSSFHTYFPKLCPPACGLEINYSRIRSNPRIAYYTGANVLDIKGSAGDFRVGLSLEPRLINNLCTACGMCAEVCPEPRQPEPGRSAGEKAAYMTHGQVFPVKYCIDPEVCKGEECGKCLEACAFDAIHLDAKEAEIELHVDKILLATGWNLYEAGKLENYRYKEEADVITNLEFEHMLAACAREKTRLARPSDGREPKRIAFVQCAGSRDVNHLPYCSAVCCPASLKHALTLDSEYPEIRSEIFYIDLRLTGRNERLLSEADEKERITLTKGKVGRILPQGGEEGIVIEVEDIDKGSRRTEAFDLVVLAMGLTPSAVPADLKRNEYGFIHPEQAEGIVAAASCKRPMDVVSSVRDATASALKTMRR